ncbi:MAG: phospho-N-acetylmuramoyl-pentapeptide-transferase [Parcubacteria group bacterium CG1_02_37_51]|uniref:Phospho-N-acetylmuramoyl-pentapeptide-transferase n=3 Tax=Candidatus Komeiliibacteriota TaxID=1817908 RepID=A0A2M7RF96_9BACT|nr:MAG: phospho-N-acetylmuramoyl-pentapeptide-transferase [Parcubacteria group bacterium CG1_02_37_51]PIY95354.1 MAG: phospho-N-acetylmuramoyl-pentapeptide-transferase [Candidatus Komeilibacteria bacterium CG_4_10_14_0_8_um_filter_37_78]
MDIITWSAVKIFVITALAFSGAGILTPLVTHFLYKYKLGKAIRSADSAPIYYEHHKQKSGTPTMGGIIIWASVLILILVIYYLALLTKFDLFIDLNFFSRAQTLLPLGALIAAALVGLVDDIFNVRKIGPNGGGLRVRHKLMLYSAIALIGAWWFYFKLDWDLLHVPFVGSWQIGWWYIPIFFFIIVATSFSVNETDGLDGLAAGVLVTNFLAFGAIAFMQGKYDLATFCGAIIGALLAFLWFNIPPARFFMGDTGSMALGVTLGVIAMLTNTLFLLPIISIVLVIESLSVIIQVLSKKLRHRKVFLSAPWHHHLEAKGWTEAKIVMRLWVISSVFSLIGFIIYILDKNV